MNWKTIFNPFEKFNEKHLLVVGIVFLIINICIAYFLGFQQDSIFHYGFADEKATIPQIIGRNVLSYLIGIVVLLILGKIYNSKTRFIDILNTVLISQIPGIFILLMSEIPLIKNILSIVQELAENNPQNIPMTDLLIICIYAFLTLGISIYGFILIYNGFKTTTNIKKWQQITLFVLVLIFTTVGSQFLIPQQF